MSTMTCDATLTDCTGRTRKGQKARQYEHREQREWREWRERRARTMEKVLKNLYESYEQVEPNEETPKQKKQKKPKKTPEERKRAQMVRVEARAIRHSEKRDERGPCTTLLEFEATAYYDELYHWDEALEFELMWEHDNSLMYSFGEDVV
jgi:hypothetical protein